MRNHESSCSQAKIYRNSSCGVSNPFIFLSKKKELFSIANLKETTDRVTHLSEVGILVDECTTLSNNYSHR